MKEDEDVSFRSEIEMTIDIAQVEKAYTGYSSSEVTAELFAHWGFDQEMVEIIRYADQPSIAPIELHEYSMALHIVKTAVPLNKPYSEQSINFALQKAKSAGFDTEILKNIMDEIGHSMKGEKCQK